MSDLIDRFAAIVGPKGILTDPTDMEPFLTDWRGRRVGRAHCVLLPRTTQEVSDICKLAHELGQPIFPQGGNTGLCYGAVPESATDAIGIVVSLRRMNQIRDIDRAADVVVAEGGVILATLQDKAAELNRMFGLTLGSEGSAMIGGLISTNAGGTGVVRYGPMRDLVVGLEVVLPDGRIMTDLSALKKDNTGYQLRQLFVGAEGSLGIITAAALKLEPKIMSEGHAWVSATDVDACVALLARLKDSHASAIQAWELCSGSQIDLVKRHVHGAVIPFDAVPAWNLFIELGASAAGVNLDEVLEELLAEGFENGQVLDAVIARSQAQANQIWHVRHSVSEANKAEGIGIVHDICVRVSQVAEFIRAADVATAARFPQARPVITCHLGDGNVHYTVMFDRADVPADPDAAEAFALDVERCLHDVAMTFGGTFSAEHGIGRKLTSEIERLTDPVRLALMHQIKALIDPHNLMNPGVLLPPARSSQP